MTLVATLGQGPLRSELAEEPFSTQTVCTGIEPTSSERRKSADKNKLDSLLVAVDGKAYTHTTHILSSRATFQVLKINVNPNTYSISMV